MLRIPTLVVSALLLGAALAPAGASTSSPAQRVVAASDAGAVQMAQNTPVPRRKAGATPAAPEQPATNGIQVRVSGWVSRCVTVSRDVPLDCSVEQSAVTGNNQLIALVRIDVHGNSKTPVMMVQLPLGLNLPAGLSLAVDDGEKSQLPVQTCDAQGCFVGSPVSEALLKALSGGQALKIDFQNQSKQTVTVSLPLANFAKLYAGVR